MYKVKFKDLILVSNKRKILSNYKTIFFFYGIGNSSEDFTFLFKNLRRSYQLIIFELPGHNKNKFSYNFNYSLENFSKSVLQLVKKKNLKNFIFFSHSVGGIIPILIAKSLKKKKNIKKFINYEGNLTNYDTNTITKKTSNYEMKEFNNKFKKLIDICLRSDSKSINLWANSLKKTSANAFYQISKDAVKFSYKRSLLVFFRVFFKRKIFLYGSTSQLYIPKFFFGSERFAIVDSGHFAFYDDRYKFLNLFFKLIYNCK